MGVEEDDETDADAEIEEDSDRFRGLVWSYISRRKLLVAITRSRARQLRNMFRRVALCIRCHSLIHGKGPMPGLCPKELEEADESIQPTVTR